jgi:hypothetical protein
MYAEAEELCAVFPLRKTALHKSQKWMAEGELLYNQ